MKIICVDDEKLILDLTMAMCRDLPQKPQVNGFQNAQDALEWVKQYGTDIALLDISLSETNGLTLAAKIKETDKNIAIIFLTGYSAYAVDAFTLHASGYLMKPISQERLETEINYAMQMIRVHRNQSVNSKVFIRTFGNFDVFADNEVVRFSRSKSKELLAYLVDKRGSCVSRADAFSALWENRQYDRSMQKQFDVILRSLRATLEQYGISDILEISRGNIRIVPEKFDCDLYRFYDGDAATVNSYRGQYMSDYSWANFTEANMTWN